MVSNKHEESTSRSCGEIYLTFGQQIDANILTTIFCELPDEQLLGLRCVSSSCKKVVDAILLQRFQQAWGVLGPGAAFSPPSIAALARCRLEHFAWCHRVSGRADSLASIAIKYGTDVAVLRRANNILSDGTLSCRHEIFVPVRDALELAGRSVTFRYDPNSKRHWIVAIYLGNADTLHSNHEVKSYDSRDEKSALLAGILQRALNLDSSTASFYLERTNGDIRAALAAAEEDERWARCMPNQNELKVLKWSKVFPRLKS
jgi:hypothetical protein